MRKSCTNLLAIIEEALSYREWGQQSRAEFITSHVNQFVNSHIDELVTRGQTAESRVKELETVIRETIPLMVQLGDYIGNANDRCETILRARNALNEQEKDGVCNGCRNPHLVVTADPLRDCSDCGDEHDPSTPCEVTS